MRISVFGTGYVGLVTGACLAEVGNHVLCVDIDQVKLDALAQGRLPIYEPGLEEIVRRNHAEGRLGFTADAAAAVGHGQIVFIAVGTPSDEDGSADLGAVLAVSRTIGAHLQRDTLIVTKSTVPVGTSGKIREIIRQVAGSNVQPRIASNPEFLKEGAAVRDFLAPDRIILGVEDAHSEQLLRRLYAPFNRNHEKIICMDIASAELTKYAANAMLATKISFMNELSGIAEQVGADIEQVRIGIGADPRIGYHFIYPGVGFGGSCFPKDLRALARSAAEHAQPALMLNAVDAVNRRQKQVLFDKISRHFGHQLAGRSIALWGLAFKPGTDDVREAPSRELMEALWSAGARVRAHDPKAMPEIRRLYGERIDLGLYADPYEALESCDALAVVTEWKSFWSPDFERIRAALSQPVIFDGRNIYDPGQLADLGFAHYAIGRPSPGPLSSHPAQAPLSARGARRLAVQ